MGVGSSSSEHQAGDSSLAAEAGESSVGDPTPLSPTGSSFGAPGCPGYPAAATGASEGDALTPHTPEPEADGGGCDSGEPTVGPEGSAGSEYEMGHGHYFTKKTFHKPTYCHHCTDMLWGLIGQGYICEGTYDKLDNAAYPLLRYIRDRTRRVRTMYDLILSLTTTTATTKNTATTNHVICMQTLHMMIQQR